MPYFENFPLIKYKIDKNSFNSVNILSRSIILSDVFDSVDAFYPYIIKDYERPDTLSYDFYGDSNYDWVIYFSNLIIDPYFDWPLFPGTFEKFLEDKYKKTIYELQSHINHYVYKGNSTQSQENINRISWKMSPFTFKTLLSINSPDTVGWEPIYTYDYETELNDNKRSIKILNSAYIDQISLEISRIFK